MAAHVVAAIDADLDEVARAEGVAVPWAVESGSRAWGFPSPDSDYDCRFVFVRGLDDYLDPWPPRDVVELPLTEVFDINGWDLRKVLTLLTHGNATAVEWLRSPLVYRGDADFRDELLALAARLVDRDALTRHYHHLAQRHRRRHLAAAEAAAGTDAQVPLKRIFYAARPALTVQWLAVHPAPALPPMDLPSLLAGTDQPADLVRCLDDLVQAKRVTREIGSGPVPAPVTALLDRALAQVPSDAGRDPGATERARRDAAGFFRDAVRRWAPAG